MIDQIKTNKCSNNIIDDHERNARYRLGDMVLIYHKKDFLPKGSHSYFIEDEKYKETLLGKYCTRFIKNDRKSNIQIFCECVIENYKEKKYDVPKDNELVIHLRLGDVFGNESVSSKKPVMRQILNKIDNYHGDIITFVTAFSYGKGTFSLEENMKRSRENSEKFFNKLMESIPKDKKIKIKSSDDVDEDFIYLCMAKNLVITGSSHFATLAYKINKYLKKQLII